MSEPLKLAILGHPRRHPGPHAPWELHRGYRLRVLGPDLLVLFLNPGGEVLSPTPQPGEEALLLLFVPEGPEPGALEQACALCREEGWEPDCLLVLSDPAQLRRRPTGKVPREILAVQVLQPLPPPGFFSTEKVLYQLGRIGSRLRRRCRWRRYLPW